MHIPDGFIAPHTWVPAAAGVSWVLIRAVRGLRQALDEHTLPRLAMLTALAYGLGLIMIPLPGGSSAHFIGVALLALIFGARLSFLAYTLVLLLQSLLFGAGGVTVLPINALLLGGLGSLTALAVYRMLTRVNESLAVFMAAFSSVMISALSIAIVLGVQPFIAVGAEGQPLFFPFDYTVTVPALLIPHLFIAAGESVLTLFVWRYARTRHWFILFEGQRS